MIPQDRKDPPLGNDSPLNQKGETDVERSERKAKDSASLDQALEETFPSSDPVSPFVAAKPAPDADDETAQLHKCSRDSCDCTVDKPNYWCSDACRDAQQGYGDSMSRQTCPCGHASCASALHIEQDVFETARAASREALPR